MAAGPTTNQQTYFAHERSESLERNEASLTFFNTKPDYCTEKNEFVAFRFKNKKKNKELNSDENLGVEVSSNHLMKVKDPMDSFLGLFNPSWAEESLMEDVNGNVVFDKAVRSSACRRTENNKNKFGRLYKNKAGNRPILPDQLPSEPQEGNIEYKLKLLNPNNERFKRLVSQMQWRLREGLGEAIYEIGVEDSGNLLGLTSHELEASMATLRRMANQLGASLTVIREKTLKGKKGQTRKVVEVLVRKVPDDQYSIEIRVAVVGNSDVGKSTLLGVLTRGELDNGRGCARLNVFRHRHEVYSGKTSSISLQIMGFDSEGHVIDQTCTRSRDYDDEDICKKSTKIVNFIDLAGDQKYIHTTAYGLSGYSPHYAILVVSAFSGVAPMTEEHISLARAFEVPIIIVVTKIDIASALQTQRTLLDLRNALTQSGHKRIPFVIINEDDAITAGSNQLDNTTVPIFCVSSVTGEGLDLLKKFLFVLPPKMSSKEREKVEQVPAEFHIYEVFHVDQKCVVGGLLTKGVIMQGSSLLIGPFDNYGFKKVRVASIHRNKVPCRVVYAGQSASLSVSSSGRYIRKGMKLLHEELHPKSCLYFQARLRVLQHNAYICKGFQTTVHIGNIRQTAVVEGILGHRGLRTNEPASVILRFIRHPEYVCVGTRFLFRSNNTKGTGQVVQVFTEDPSNADFDSDCSR